MGYRTLHACLEDVARTGRMVRIEEPVSPFLEMAALQRRVFEAGGPALYFANTGTFPMVSNLYGTMERIRFIFRDALEPIRSAVEWGADPLAQLAECAGKREWRRFFSFRSLCGSAWFARPKMVRRAPVTACETTLRRLPQLVSWPHDGGPFVTLPLVYTEDPVRHGVMRSNLGMYRVQLAGNDYLADREAGLHYQLHRGIAAHHAAALERGTSLPVNVFIGGAPAMTLAAVMPFPEGVSEIPFAGILGRHRIPMCPGPVGNDSVPTPHLYAEADFCISGRLDRATLKKEGPFGDHLGYYSLGHDFPVLHVEKVYHRKNAVWPFTVVGRPPQEDSMFGQFIQEITETAVPRKLPGIHAVRAVDEAGVHPLCLAIGSEQYVPYRPRRSAQLDTLAHAILGFGQLSLAKYLLIVAREDDPGLEIGDVAGFFQHLLERVDWRTDLHFLTRTTCDTLDYTGGAINRGSKLIITACGNPVRKLGVSTDTFPRLPDALRNPRLALPGVLVVESTKDWEPGHRTLANETDSFPLIVLVDDSAAASENMRNFLWTTFTKSDPACDVDGFGAFTDHKHWGCTGPLVIDARRKPHHAPELEEDTDVARAIDAKIERLAARGGPLHGVF